VRRSKAERAVPPVDLDAVQDAPVSPQGEWLGWCDQQDQDWTKQVQDYDPREW